MSPGGRGGVLGGVKVKLLLSVMVADSPVSKQMVAVFFVDFGNRGQAGGGISGCSIQWFSLV